MSFGLAFFGGLSSWVIDDGIRLQHGGSYDVTGAHRWLFAFLAAVVGELGTLVELAVFRS
jgi:hypothetical protein